MSAQAVFTLVYLASLTTGLAVLAAALRSRRTPPTVPPRVPGAERLNSADEQHVATILTAAAHLAARHSRAA